jgi:hypothetical protein
VDTFRWEAMMKKKKMVKPHQLSKWRVYPGDGA